LAPGVHRPWTVTLSGVRALPSSYTQPSVEQAAGWYDAAPSPLYTHRVEPGARWK
jgi:hypothetical protein